MAKRQKKSETGSPEPANRQPRRAGINRQFFEIVNWKKAQPRMADGPNSWCKVYTSLLDHDGFEGLADADRVLIMMLWAYATRSGRHVFPADPAWIHKRIPILNSEPDLVPLMAAKDVYGHPAPFIRYCEPPGLVGEQEDKKPPAEETAVKPVKKTPKKNTAKKAAKKTKTKKTREEESRVEEKREEKTKPCRVSEEKNTEEKTRIKTRVSTAEQTEQPAAVSTDAEKSEQPENPNDSEVGTAEAHAVPKPSHSAHRGPEAIGTIIGQRFPDHWADEDAEAFGWEIVAALGYSTDRHNIKSRSEWGAFAKWWCDIKKSCPVMELDRLRDKAIIKAKFVASPKCRNARNKSAVWFKIMAGEVGAGGGRGGRARASP